MNRWLIEMCALRDNFPVSFLQLERGMMSYVVAPLNAIFTF